MQVRRFRHRWLPLALVLPALIAGGCKDDRGAITAPDTGSLDGGILFGSALVSSLFFSFQNDLASLLLAVHESGVVSLPFTLQACSGGGIAVISDNNDTDPNSYRVALGVAGGLPYVINCDTGIPLSFNGNMVFRFVETSPGLEYLVQMEFVHATGTPRGVTLQLPQGFGGGAILQITTPYDDDPTDAYPQGGVRYTLDRARADLAAQTGNLRMTGTLRLGDRGVPLTFVEELDLHYLVRHSTDPGSENVVLFDAWPGGTYEIASSSPGASGAPPAPGFPVHLFFDGRGGLSFSFEGHDCESNLITGENPCDEF